MNWYLLALISFVTMCVADVIIRVVMKEAESDPMASSVFFQFLLAAIVGTFALVHGFVMPPLASYPFNFLISSVFWALTTLFLFKAAKTIGASDIVILSAFGAVITIILSVFFLGDSFSLLQVLGAILIIVPVILVQTKVSFRDKQGVVFAILATLFGSIAVVSDAFVVTRYDPISYTAVMCLFPGIVLLLIEPKVIFRFKKFFKGSYLKSNLVYGALYSIHAVFYYMAIAAGATSSQMSAMFKASLIFVIILAAIFIKERERLVLKLTAAVVATLGVLLVSGII